MAYSRKPKEKEFDAICLLMDVGGSSKRSGYLYEMVQCVSAQLQRKIYSESDDRFGIVLFGTSKTNNPLRSPHISIMDTEGFCRPTFKMVEYVEKTVKTLATEESVDWLDGLVVAMNYLKEAIDSSSAVRLKRIILFSDLGSPTNDDKFDTISQALISEGIEFLFICPEWWHDPNFFANGGIGNNHQDGAANDHGANNHRYERKPRTAMQSASELLIDHLVESTAGLKVSIDVALATFLNRERRKKKSMPWKVDLEIGGQIRIPVTGYVFVRRENPKSWQKCLAKGEAEPLKPETTYVKNDEDLSVVNATDLVESYKYGSELITISDVDKASSLQNFGAKSLKLIGFVKQTDLPLQLALGDGCMIFQPQEDHQSSAASFSSLVNALHTEEMAALVRRVYNARSAPKLAVLVPSMRLDPVTSEESLTMIYVEMPFSEDIRYFSFAPLFNETHQPTEDQQQAVDELIDAMLIKDSSTLQTESILNPYFQHLYDCLTHRALQPGRILPKPSEHTLKIMAQPDEISQAAEEPLKKIRKLFKLEVMELKKEKNTGEKMFSEAQKRRAQDEAGSTREVTVEDLSLSSVNHVTSVGTATPAEDFNQLLRQGFDLNIVRVQMEKVIVRLVNAGQNYSEKILDALAAYRQACLDFKRPGPYNTFIRDLKPEIMSSSSYPDLWPDLSNRDLGLIGHHIDKNSDISQEEVKAFFGHNEASGQNSDDVTMKDVGKHGQEESADDMIDDL